MRTAMVSLALIAACLTSVQSAPSSAGSLPLRIGLDKYFLHTTALLISSDKPFALQDAATGRVLAQAAPDTVFKITPTSEGLRIKREDGEEQDEESAVVAVPSGDSPLKIARQDTATHGHSLRWRHYRGSLTLRREPDGTLRVINTVSLEAYLYGVIPAEIGGDAPLEAMKAQAVAARTFALKNRGRFANAGFDLDDTTKSEGYTGLDGETPRSNAAVDETRGQVLTYQGRLIDAPYSTDSGGMTACAGNSPYLQAVVDAPAGGPDYAAGNPYHNWTKVYTKAELAAALTKDPRTQVSSFVSLSLDGLDASGRITTATVAGLDGAMKTVTGPQLRAILGYDVLRSTRLTLTVTPEGDYHFDGKGWGHGLGMSQLGAVAMASAPYHQSYRQILKHYYVGTELTDAASVSDLHLAVRRGFTGTAPHLRQAAN